MKRDKESVQIVCREAKSRNEEASNESNTKKTNQMDIRPACVLVLVFVFECVYVRVYATQSSVFSLLHIFEPPPHKIKTNSAATTQKHEKLCALNLDGG